MAGDETILIVDDARLARQMVRSYVAHLRPDMGIFEAVDGPDALRVLETMPTLTYSTIDYNMPGMNGIDLAQTIRQRHPGVRIAIVTANVQGALRKRAAEIGVEFIDKPINESKVGAFIGPAGPPETHS
jgi:CheY-like chemotaxis protein